MFSPGAIATVLGMTSLAPELSGFSGCPEDLRAGIAPFICHGPAWPGHPRLSDLARAARTRILLCATLCALGALCVTLMTCHSATANVGSRRVDETPKRTGSSRPNVVAPDADGTAQKRTSKYSQPRMVVDGMGRPEPTGDGVRDRAGSARSAMRPGHPFVWSAHAIGVLGLPISNQNPPRISLTDKQRHRKC